MDPITIGLIASALRAAIDAYGEIEKAKGGLTEEQRAVRKQIRKDLVAMAHELAGSDADEGS